MKLVHYSDKPLDKLYSTCQIEETSRYDKPFGLWVSVVGEQDWKTWCESENFRTNNMSVENEIVLCEEHKILIIIGEEEIKEFQSNYIKECIHYYNNGINWLEVSKKYQGVIIAPYCWEARWKMSWYYTWDCASGCIWNKEAIKEIICKVR